VVIPAPEGPEPPFKVLRGLSLFHRGFPWVWGREANLVYGRVGGYPGVYAQVYIGRGTPTLVYALPTTLGIHQSLLHHPPVLHVSVAQTVGLRRSPGLKTENTRG